MLLVACQPTAPVPVRIGALYPLTGDLADKGADSRSGVLLAIEDINASGGIASLGNAPVSLASADTRGQPEVGASETERLIVEERVVGLLGTYQSSVTKPATQVAERLQTPFVVSISIADIIVERGFRYTFRVSPRLADYCRDRLRFLEDHSARTGRPVRRVALLYENTDFGASSALEQKRALRQRGFELVAQVPYVAAGVRDLSPQIAQVLAARPDVVLTTTYLHDAVLIRRALAAAPSPPLMVDLAGGTISPEYAQALGELADGTFAVSEFAPTRPEGVALNARFRARFGRDVTGDSAYAYQATWVLADAIDRARSRSRDAVRDALAQTDLRPGPRMVLPAPRLHFGPDGQNEAGQLFVVQLQRGRLVPVWPPTATPEHP